MKVLVVQVDKLLKNGCKKVPWPSASAVAI